jgi:hypothetical protein
MTNKIDKKSIKNILEVFLFGRKMALIEKTLRQNNIFRYFINRLFLKTNILLNNNSLKNE